MDYEVKDFLGQEFITATKDDGTILLIPVDETNADYQQYLADTGLE